MRHILHDISKYYSTTYTSSILLTVLIYFAFSYFLLCTSDIHWAGLVCRTKLNLCEICNIL